MTRGRTSVEGKASGPHCGVITIRRPTKRKPTRNGPSWRVSPVPARPGEGRLTELTAGAQRGRWQLEEDPAKLWSHYLLLVAVEEAFKNLKGDLAIRPVFHQLEARIEAHVFIAFLAYCLHVTLARRRRPTSPPQLGQQRRSPWRDAQKPPPLTQGRADPPLANSSFDDPPPRLIDDCVPASTKLSNQCRFTAA